MGIIPNNLPLVLLNICDIMCSHIPSRCPSNTLVAKAFVNESTRFSVVSILLTTMSPLWTISLYRLFLHSMCFPLLCLLGSLEFATAPLLSQYSVIGSYALGTSCRSIRKLRSQIASLAATYSASMVESAVQLCLILLHTIASPPRVNTELEVDFLESLSD